LLPFLGATPVNERVVVDGRMVFAAGVTLFVFKYLARLDVHANFLCHRAALNGAVRSTYFFLQLLVVI
jgi:hypothetical protein